MMTLEQLKSLTPESRFTVKGGNVYRPYVFSSGGKPSGIIFAANGTAVCARRDRDGKQYGPIRVFTSDKIDLVN